MKSYIFMGVMACALTLPSIASADITVNLPSGSNAKGVKSSHYLLSNLRNARRQTDLIKLEDKVNSQKDMALITLDGTSPSRYQIVVPGSEEEIQIFAAPDDDITVDVASLSPLTYTVKGTPLMEGISTLRERTMPVVEKFGQLPPPQNEAERDVFQQLYTQYQTILEDYIKDFPESPAVAYALLSLDDDGFDGIFPGISQIAKSSLLYPFVEQRGMALAAEKERQRKLDNLQSGEIQAPDFTLENTEGKQVSLSEFRGKWVILDFWGSWCIWCIKGFPELKEAYQKYAGQLEIIGLDCNEGTEVWKAAVKKYELPWVNLYCPKGNPLLKDYNVEGFPTKAIIDPEGKIRNVTVGHNPDFFTILDRLISESAN